MPDKPPFLSEPQWSLLVHAVSQQRQGTPTYEKISSYYTQQRSLEALMKHGMIKEDFDVRDPDQRTSLEEHTKNCIVSARHYLDHGEWQKALHALEGAESHQKTLAKKAYWITDEAKKHLFAT